MAGESHGKVGAQTPADVDESSSAAPALDGWILATLPRAVAFAMGLVKNREVAEDVVHDCYCRLLARAGDYDLRADGARLLFRSITNACIDRSRRKSTVSLFEGSPEGDDLPGRMMDLADQRSLEPWQIANHAELQQAVSAGLEKLPIGQRAALELKTLGHSLQEIAEALDVTPTNAGVLIHRARQALARHLANRVDL